MACGWDAAAQVVELHKAKDAAEARADAAERMLAVTEKKLKQTQAELAETLEALDTAAGPSAKRSAEAAARTAAAWWNAQVE